MKTIGDLLSIGLVLVALFILILSLRETGGLMLVGVVGSIITILVEGWYLINYIQEKWLK